jgi:DNA-binding NtrC family response regulator
MRSVYAAAAKLAELDTPILIIGETGTGKCTIARRIHDSSARRNEPFRVVDASTFSQSVEKKSVADKLIGTSGTVFFTDAAQLILPAQRRILNLIRSDSRKTPRLIVATNDALDQAVRANQIDEDFYYAIGSVCLRIAPLRARRQDIRTLSQYFLRQYAYEFGRTKPEPSAQAVEFLSNYRWPGNVEELETAMKSLVVTGDERLVLAALRASSWTKGNHASQTASLKQASRAASFEAERELITDVLASTGGNRKQAARQLQISYKALLYKLKRIAIESPAMQPALESGEV